MNEGQLLSLVSGLMVLVLVVGGLMRRRMKPGESVRLAMIWIGILIVATLAVTWIQKLRT